MSQALVQMWQSTMVITFTEELGLSEKWSSTLGIVIGFSSVATSIMVGTFMDFFRKKMKLAIIATLSGSFVLSFIITLISEKVIIIEDELSFKITLYILCISAVSLACSAAPITFEFCVEECFPVSEGLLGKHNDDSITFEIFHNSGNWMTIGFNIPSGLYFGLFQIPGIGTRWMNYTLLIAILTGLPPILLVKETYKRSKIDG